MALTGYIDTDTQILWHLDHIDIICFSLVNKTAYEYQTTMNLVREINLVQRNAPWNEAEFIYDEGLYDAFRLYLSRHIFTWLDFIDSDFFRASTVGHEEDTISDDDPTSPSEARRQKKKKFLDIMTEVEVCNDDDLIEQYWNIGIPCFPANISRLSFDGGQFFTGCRTDVYDELKLKGYDFVFLIRDFHDLDPRLFKVNGYADSTTKKITIKASMSTIRTACTFFRLPIMKWIMEMTKCKDGIRLGGCIIKRGRTIVMDYLKSINQLTYRPSFWKTASVANCVSMLQYLHDNFGPTELIPSILNKMIGNGACDALMWWRRDMENLPSVINVSILDCLHSCGNYPSVQMRCKTIETAIKLGVKITIVIGKKDILINNLYFPLLEKLALMEIPIEIDKQAMKFSIIDGNSLFPIWHLNTSTGTIDYTELLNDAISNGCAKLVRWILQKGELSMNISKSFVLSATSIGNASIIKILIKNKMDIIFHPSMTMSLRKQFKTALNKT